uniref:Myosin_tail_1 domain-containing protein n=1 Tax=Anisakis simplex TaxID=6269 RepID=A0A0M3J4T4_ANISI
LAALEAKYQNELEDERDQHQHDADVLKATEEELRTKITLLETKLEAANDREKNLHNEIAEWEDKYDSVNKELQKVRDELDVVRSDYEKEIEKAKTDLNNAQAEIKNLEAQIETLKSQLNSANDRANSLTRTVNEQNGKIRER